VENRCQTASATKSDAVVMVTERMIEGPLERSRGGAGARAFETAVSPEGEFAVSG